jgi:hypothetical protein
MTQQKKAPSAACREFEAELVLYYYGELQGVSCTRMESHLGDCESCRSALQEMRSILPMTVKPDQPPESFWQDYDRQLRQKLFEADQKKTSWLTFPLVNRSWTVPALAAAAVVTLAIAFTLARVPWLSRETPPREELFMEVLPMAENLEFYRTMEVLDALDLLEFMGSQAKA